METSSQMNRNLHGYCNLNNTTTVKFTTVLYSRVNYSIIQLEGMHPTGTYFWIAVFFLSPFFYRGAPPIPPLPPPPLPLAAILDFSDVKNVTDGRREGKGTRARFLLLIQYSTLQFTTVQYCYYDLLTVLDPVSTAPKLPLPSTTTDIYQANKVTHGAR